MIKFKTVFLMQLKEKLDLSYLKDKKKLLFKIVFSILGFIAISALSFLILYVCQFLHLFSALDHIPITVMSVIFFIIFIINIISCTIGLSQSLYYGKDNQFLITFPVNPSSLFFSKMLVYYINEIKKNFSFLIPVFFAYGILSGFNVGYYFWMIFILTIFASLPVLIAGILSIPTNYIIRFLKRYPIIKVILIALILGGLVTGVVFLIKAVPEDINLIKSWTFVSKQIRAFLEGFNDKMWIVYDFTKSFCGIYVNFKQILFTEYSYIYPLSMLGVIIVLFGLNYLLSRPFYIQIISKQFEFNKKVIKRERKNNVHNVWMSTSIYESLRCLKSPIILSTSIITMIVTPIAILLLNSIYKAINTATIGDYFIVCFNILIILLFITSNNINVSTIYSKDANSLYLNKTKPNKPYQILFPRLSFNIIVSLITLISSFTIFATSAKIDTKDAITVFFLLLTIILVHIVWSAEIDFLHPKANLMKDDTSSGFNPNELKSAILVFALSFIVFGAAIFLLLKTTTYTWARLLIVAVLLLVLRIYLFYYKAKVLFKEK